ncbi:MAG: hypothetical protein JST54_24360 [Deltaproteobacteria bacterium]|nr:hypothetical protein [Deltaproteobacteria bacterium]
MRRICLALLVLASACGGKSNTAVTDQGTTLTPKSDAAVVGTFFGFIPITEVIVTDVPNLCGEFSNISPCNSSSSTIPVTSGSMLVVAVISTASGDYKVSDPSAEVTDGGGSFFGAPAAEVEFESFASGAAPVQDVAVSGTVHLDKADVGGSAEGSYDVTMKSGAHLKGDFHGDNCPALSALLTSSTSDSCSDSFGSSTCSRSCTCQGSTVAANCSAPPDGGDYWTCSCTDKTGAHTTCNMTTPVSSSSCDQGESCCPMTF